MSILAIDPGTRQSGWVVWDGKTILSCGKEENEIVLKLCEAHSVATRCVLEMVGSYGTGLAMGKDIYTTCIWLGEFKHAFGRQRTEVIVRQAVKAHLCGSAKAKDSNVRQAIIDRFGGEAAVDREKLCGKRKNKSHDETCVLCHGTGIEREAGPLAAVHADIWSALALAMTWWDTRVDGKWRITEELV